MKITAWSQLPNAVHINRVLASVKAHLDVWGAARDAARFAAWHKAHDAAWNAARGAARDAAWFAAHDAAWFAAEDAAGDAAKYAAGDAMVALIAWDDSAQYLSMTSEQLKMWYHLTERPACLLLLPAVRAFEQIEEMEMV